MFAAELSSTMFLTPSQCRMLLSENTEQTEAEQRCDQTIHIY